MSTVTTLPESTLAVATTPAEKAPTERINLLLDRDTIAWLDDEARRVNAHHDGELSRSAIIRGLVAGFRNAGATLGNCADEHALKAAVARWLRSAATMREGQR